MRAEEGSGLSGDQRTYENRDKLPKWKFAGGANLIYGLRIVLCFSLRSAQPLKPNLGTKQNIYLKPAQISTQQSSVLAVILSCTRIPLDQPSICERLVIGVVPVVSCSSRRAEFPLMWEDGYNVLELVLILWLCNKDHLMYTSRVHTQIDPHLLRLLQSSINCVALNSSLLQNSFWRKHSYFMASFFTLEFC